MFYVRREAARLPLRAHRITEKGLARQVASQYESRCPCDEHGYENAVNSVRQGFLQLREQRRRNCLAYPGIEQKADDVEPGVGRGAALGKQVAGHLVYACQRSLQALIENPAEECNPNGAAQNAVEHVRTCRCAASVPCHAGLNRDDVSRLREPESHAHNEAAGAE